MFSHLSIGVNWLNELCFQYICFSSLINHSKCFTQTSIQSFVCHTPLIHLRTLSTTSEKVERNLCPKTHLFLSVAAYQLIKSVIYFPCECWWLFFCHLCNFKLPYILSFHLNIMGRKFAKWERLTKYLVSILFHHPNEQCAIEHTSQSYIYTFIFFHNEIKFQYILRITFNTFQINRKESACCKAFIFPYVFKKIAIPFT